MSPSRAIVAAPGVNMPLPSAVRHKTFLVGHATAAPTARGKAIQSTSPCYPTVVSRSPAVAAIHGRLCGLRRRHIDFQRLEAQPLQVLQRDFHCEHHWPRSRFSAKSSFPRVRLRQRVGAPT